MDRLSDWRAAAWIALALAALAAAAALLVPRAFDHRGGTQAGVVQATLVPRTHLFGQTVTATLAVPARVQVSARFDPYQVVARSITRQGGLVRYQFTLDCLRTQCLGPAGAERQIELPPVALVLPDGRKALASWPTLREASRLAPQDLASPRLRGDLAAPAPSGGHRELAGVLLGIGAALALAGAGLLGLRWLGWRPPPLLAAGPGRTTPLEYALLVSGLAAGGRAQDRRAALDALAVALDERGLRDLAAEARRLAWSEPPPAGEAVRELAAAIRHEA